MRILTKADASVAIDDRRPPSSDTLNLWHDRLRGPRDSGGRRIFTEEVCRRIREAREQARARRA